MYIFILFSLIFTAFMLFLGFVLGSKSQINANQSEPFESGISSFGNTKINFFVNFYLISILFVMFDAESIYIYFWSISVKKLGINGFIKSLTLIFILISNLLYLFRNNFFEINKKNSRNTEKKKWNIH